MGGGDLNLKKSWHPNTMRNMEKVWKAEQRDNEERRRIAELQHEINAERSREDMQRFAESSGVVEKKDNTKLDWMYKGPRGIVDREEYLLGRSIDKTFEQLEQSESEGKALSSRKNAVERGDECLPNSIRFAADQQVDLARKMMEDPLLAIKKKEVESRQQILSNPVKLKQLKRLVEMQSKKKQKKKKEKKKKKSSRAKDSDCASDDDSKLDALLVKKLSCLKNAGLLKGFADDDVLEHKSKKHRKNRSNSDHRDDKNSSNRRKHRKTENHDHTDAHSYKRHKSEDHDFDSDHSDTKNSYSKKKSSKCKVHSSHSDHRDTKNSSPRFKHSKWKERDNDSDRRDVKTTSNRNDKAKSIDNDSEHRDAESSYYRHLKSKEVWQRGKIKTERSASVEKHNEGRSNSIKSGLDPDNYQRRKPENRNQQNSDEYRQRQVKREKDRTPNRPYKRGASPVGRRKQHRVEVEKVRRESPRHTTRRDSGDSFDLDKRERKSSVDRSEKSRTRRDSASSLDLDSRSKDDKSAKVKKQQAEKPESSSDDDSDCSYSSSEKGVPRKSLIRIKRKRELYSEERTIPKFGLMLPDGSKPVPKPAVRVQEKQKHEEPEKPKWVKMERKKLDEKEKEARRREMMENSDWREKERERNKRRHELDLEKERRHQATKFDEDFARKQFAHAVSHTTVEERIKSNINNIQRSKMAMERNFARR